MDQGRDAAGVDPQVSAGDAIRRIPTIVGPTAAGKTRAALELAAGRRDIEIISADSRQIYIGMDVGTAKPTPEELASAPHHMIDIVLPDVQYSAGMYADAAAAAIRDILGRGGLPLVVGGSGFYVKALFEGLGAPTADPAIVAALEARSREEGGDLLHRELAAIDPVAAAAHSPHNIVKTIRALACWYQTGRPYSAFLDTPSAAPEWTPAYLGIAPEREVLYERIDRRVLEMLDLGLLEETRRLLDAGVAGDAPGMRTVGYAEMIAFLRGEIAWERAVELAQQSTRRYAKRQMTWFRRIEGVQWIDGPDPEAAGAWLNRVV